jgi:uncharacterized membrane protein YgcG
MTPVETGMIFKRQTAELRMTEKPKGPELSIFEGKLYNRLHACGGVVTDADLRNYVAPHLADLKGSLYDELVYRGYYLTKPDTVRIGWLVGGAAIIFGLGFIATALNPYKEPLAAIIGGIVGFILLVPFSLQMPRRTRMGAIAHRKAQGFQEFMRRAKGDEIEWMAEQHPDPALFEKYLPHAIAFGLAAQWADRFSSIVTQPPSWYITPYGYGWNPYLFSHDIDSLSNSMASAAATPPRSSGASGGSSGFGGGGFSGGGFGGGGGGSW